MSSSYMQPGAYIRAINVGGEEEGYKRAANFDFLTKLTLCVLVGWAQRLHIRIWPVQRTRVWWLESVLLRHEVNNSETLALNEDFLITHLVQRVEPLALLEAHDIAALVAKTVPLVFTESFAVKALVELSDSVALVSDVWIVAEMFEQSLLDVGESLWLEARAGTTETLPLVDGLFLQRTKNIIETFSINERTSRGIGVADNFIVFEALRRVSPTALTTAVALLESSRIDAFVSPVTHVDFSEVAGRGLNFAESLVLTDAGRVIPPFSLADTYDMSAVGEGIRVIPPYTVSDSFDLSLAMEDISYIPPYTVTDAFDLSAATETYSLPPIYKVSDTYALSAIAESLRTIPPYQVDEIATILTNASENITTIPPYTAADTLLIGESQAIVPPTTGTDTLVVTDTVTVVPPLQVADSLVLAETGNVEPSQWRGGTDNIVLSTNVDIIRTTSGQQLWLTNGEYKLIINEELALSGVVVGEVGAVWDEAVWDNSDWGVRWVINY